MVVWGGLAVPSRRAGKLRPLPFPRAVLLYCVALCAPTEPPAALGLRAPRACARLLRQAGADVGVDEALHYLGEQQSERSDPVRWMYRYSDRADRPATGVFFLSGRRLLSGAAVCA